MTIEEIKSLEIYKNCKSTYNLPSISKEQLDLLKNGKYSETLDECHKSTRIEDYIEMNVKYVLIDILFDELHLELR